LRVLDDLLQTGVWRGIVAEHGTPVVIVDAAIIRERCRMLRAAFPNARLFYAPKANYNPHIVLVAAEGRHRRVSLRDRPASPGIEPADIVYVRAMSRAT
jgi:hypothetical protein